MKTIRYHAVALLIGLLTVGAHADTIVSLTGDDMMKLNTKSFSVKAGTDVDKFAQDAALAASTGFIPPAGKNYILAQTKMLGGGQKTSIKFTAPKKGNYTYLCTFPGHAVLMRGVMIVK